MDPLLRLAFSSSPDLMPNAEGDGAGGMWHSPHEHPALCHIPANLSQTPALPDSLKKTHKIKPNQSSPRDKDGSGSMWVDDVGCAALPHTLARQQVWPQPSLGGSSTRREWGSTTLCLSFPFPYLKHFLFFEHSGHKAQQSLHFTFSPKAQLPYKTLGESLM